MLKSAPVRLWRSTCKRRATEIESGAGRLFGVRGGFGVVGLGRCALCGSGGEGESLMRDRPRQAARLKLGRRAGWRLLSGPGLLLCRASHYRSLRYVSKEANVALTQGTGRGHARRPHILFPFPATLKTFMAATHLAYIFPARVARPGVAEGPPETLDKVAGE